MMPWINKSDLYGVDVLDLRAAGYMARYAPDYYYRDFPAIIPGRMER